MIAGRRLMQPWHRWKFDSTRVNLDETAKILIDTSTRGHYNHVYMVQDVLY
jgi:hypothetical protein